VLRTGIQPLMVPVKCPISKPRLNTLLYVHLAPINLVVFKGACHAPHWPRTTRTLRG